jgi:hypothetical protein
MEEYLIYLCKSGPVADLSGMAALVDPPSGVDGRRRGRTRQTASGVRERAGPRGGSVNRADSDDAGACKEPISTSR